MNKIKRLSALTIIMIGQLSCRITQQAYPDSMPTPVYVQVPSLLEREIKYTFSIETIPGAECSAGVAFYDTNDKWIIRELPTIQANEDGACQWTWEVPNEAKAGIAEFRGHIEGNGQERNTYPATFCIESCPD
jgi:hypothetical protein